MLLPSINWLPRREGVAEPCWCPLAVHLAFSCHGWAKVSNWEEFMRRQTRMRGATLHLEWVIVLVCPLMKVLLSATAFWMLLNMNSMLNVLLLWHETRPWLSEKNFRNENMSGFNPIVLVPVRTPKATYCSTFQIKSRFGLLPHSVAVCLDQHSGSHCSLAQISQCSCVSMA